MDLNPTPNLFSAGVKSDEPSQVLYINPDPQDEETSDCPLLTPSPPPDHTPNSSDPAAGSIFNPLESTKLEIPSVTIKNLNTEDGLKAFMNIVNSSSNNIPNDEPSSRDPMVESSSSEESSVNKEPVCTQLLTQLNTAYQHLAPDAQAIFCNQETTGKPPLVGIQLVVPKPPKDYSFARWNWPRIREMLFWLMICLLSFCTIFAIRGIIFMPRRCDSPSEWWQGKLFYEIFPASFQDSSKSGDGIGDLRGIQMRIDYLKGLGVKVIRLNSIFPSENYPQHYMNVKSLTKIDGSLGTMSDFENLIEALHRDDIKLVLDLPINSLSKQLNSNKFNNDGDEILSKLKREVQNNSTYLIDNGINIKKIMNNTIDSVEKPKFERFTSNHIMTTTVEDEVTSAIKFWLRKKVDGFYLKNLEYFINNTNFLNYLSEWRDIMGYNKILICHWNAINNVENSELQRKIIMSIDLIDVKLKLNNGTKNIKQQIDRVLSSSLFHDDLIKNYNNHPWIHWTIGNVETNRLISTLNMRNASLAATILSIMLPGTPSLFYGDEIGMDECQCEDHRDLNHLHNLSPMAWENVPGSNDNFAPNGVVPWLPKSSVPLSLSHHIYYIIIEMIKLRQNTAPIFIDTALKHDRIRVNCDIRYIADELIIIERWYPRQNTYVLVANFGNSIQTKDLSFLYYEGKVLIGPKHKINQNLYFKDLRIPPGEIYVIKLEK